MEGIIMNSQLLSYKYLDLESFPNIVLTLHDFESDSEYESLIYVLDKLMESKESFSLLVETIHVRNMKIKYLFSFGKYIKSLSMNNDIKLSQTRINVYDNINFNILTTLFCVLAKPISPVHVYLFEGGYNDDNKVRKLQKVKVFEPK